MLKPAKLSPLARWKASDGGAASLLFARKKLAPLSQRRLLSCSCLQSVLRVILAGDRQWLVRVSTVAGVVVLRTLLQDRIASLNGKSVDLVLRQDLSGFIR